MKILEVSDVWKSFGGVQAVADLSFQAHEGSVHGLIGPNGAGKTTVLGLIAGEIEPDRGVIKWADRPVGRRISPTKIGIGRTFQEPSPLGNMTVLENVLVGLHTRGQAGYLRSLIRSPSMREEEKALYARAVELLSIVGLSDRLGHRADELSFGELRLLEVVRMLATEPELILLDEPAAGLNRLESERLTELLNQLRDDGRCILLIEHDMKVVFRVCDVITVINSGRWIAAGSPSDIQDNPAVQEAYLSVSHREELL